MATPITSVIQKIFEEQVQFRSAVSESVGTALGQAINALIDSYNLSDQPKLNYQQFLSSGTWTTSTKLRGGIALAIGCGGGGGGEAGSGTSSAISGEGGRGAPLGVRLITGITAGNSYSVSIGVGGTGGAPNLGNGGNGGTTSVTVGATSYTFYGAYGGGFVITRTNNITAGSAQGGNGVAALSGVGQSGPAGENTFAFLGGDGGSPDSGSKSGGGGGGAGPFGQGGDGGDGGVNNATAAAANTGGGGGGGCSSSPNGGDGKAGGSGRLILLWLEAGT